MPDQECLVSIQYFPTIEFFSRIIHFQVVQIEAHEHYQKRSYRNKCALAGANGVLWLSVPLLKGKNNQKAIRDVGIAYHETWQAQHWQSILSAYGKSPFFEHYADEIKDCLTMEFDKLFDLNLQVLKTCSHLMGLATEFTLSEKYRVPRENVDNDLRSITKIKKKKDGSPESTAITNQDYHPPTYQQAFQNKYPFVANLSILDLLFCKGPESFYLLENACEKPE